MERLRGETRLIPRANLAAEPMVVLRPELMDWVARARQVLDCTCTFLTTTARAVRQSRQVSR